jgi:DNA-binding IclR family transcriptional regulator
MELTRRQKSEGVLAHLRGVGPQTAAQIQEDLRMTKREVEDALHILVRQGAVEYDWPTTSPLTYKASQEEAHETKS